MINEIYLPKRELFDEGATLSYVSRLNGLEILKASIEKREADIIRALKLDLNKQKFEAYTNEIGLVYEEINTAIKTLSSGWAR